MTNNQVIINGPELPPVIYDVPVNRLSSGTLLELSDGRWGVKTVAGIAIFRGGSVNNDILLLQVMNYDLRCRVLPGKVEITYSL